MTLGFRTYIHILFYRPRLYNTAAVSLNFMVPSCMKIMLFCLVLITNRLMNLCLNLTCVYVLRLVEDCQTPLGGRLLEWVTLGYPGEKYPVALGIVSQSFVACSINFSKPITTGHSGRPQKTSRREDGALLRLVRRFPFLTSTVVKQRLSTRTALNRLRASGYRARRPIGRPMLTPGQKAARLYWCQQRRNWNIRYWRKMHLSDESRFLLHMTDCRVRVWRQRNTAYSQRHVQETVPFGESSIMVWGCVSHDCKLDLVTVQGALTGQKYQTDILETVVIPHFDDHPLLTRPVFMDDNARPHISRAVIEFLHQNAISTLPWPARSPDLNPLEHLWDILGRKIREITPPVQTILELEAALHQEWQQISQQRIQRLVQGMRRRLDATFAVQGGYIKYWLKGTEINCLR